MSTATDLQKRAMDEAVKALTARLRERDAADPDRREPADVFALRFITDMNGRGWRLTPAGRIRPWSTLPFAPSRADEDAWARGVEYARSLLARTSQPDPDQEGQDE